MSRADLENFARLEQEVRLAIQKRLKQLEAQLKAEQEQTILLNDNYLLLKHQIFGKSSEREPVASEEQPCEVEPKSSKKTKIQLPSQRYPEAELVVQDIEFRDMPTCTCCGSKMEDSGLTEDAEYLTVKPKQFSVVRQRRHKYRCRKCHGDLKTAPGLPRITPGSSYSDEMAIDVALSKYCDLVPVERYARIAGREGLKDLPSQSLIELTHNLAEFVKPATDRILDLEIKKSLCLHADETPHRMLEGSAKSNWYLWGFSTKVASFFEIHDTRSGDVASGLLKDSACEFLVSDVFSGYAKAVRETNEDRQSKQRPEIRSIYCNAHARRKFKEARERFEEAQEYLNLYRKIYRLEGEIREGPSPPNEALELRRKMGELFEELRLRATAEYPSHPAKSSMAKALGYFLENYSGLTRFLNRLDLPIDNNPQERLLRNPVIGRKTWYGTHSERGAKTTATMFTLIESCKLNGINPREYFKKLVEDLHQNKPAYTPNEYRQLRNTEPAPAG